MDTNSSIKSNDQCKNVSDIESHLQQLNLNIIEQQQQQDWLSNLSEDLLFTILVFIGPSDVDNNVKLVNRSLHHSTSHSMQLWREFCVLTGKCLPKKYANTKESKNESNAFRPMTLSAGLKNDTDEPERENKFRQYYHRNPCVPIDFETISSALVHCPRTPMKVIENESELDFSETGTVCVMPGIYKERIVIKGEEWGVGSTCNKAVSIRACFPQEGATIVHYTDSQDAKNQPCVSVSTRDATNLGAQKGISVNISYLALVHCTSGSDLWGGNAALVVDGARAQVVMNSCLIQSHSGRGIVCTNQAELKISASSVTDCAATGLYLGDWGSRAHVLGCNIVRNGYGSRKLLSSDEGRQELENVLTEWTRLRANNGVANNATQQIEQFNSIPPGHSGIYTEGAMCWMEDSLIASNCFTGLSVVRNGFVSLSGCDLPASGNRVGHPISIEDDHDVLNNRLQGARIRGGVVEGPRPNDYSNSQKYQDKLRDGASFACDLVRSVMTDEKLHSILRNG